MRLYRRLPDKHAGGWEMGHISPAFFGSGDDPISSAERDYYRARATEERDAASAASDASSAGLHRQMARMYDSLADDYDRPRHSVAPAW